MESGLRRPGTPLVLLRLGKVFEGRGSGGVCGAGGGGGVNGVGVEGFSLGFFLLLKMYFFDIEKS